MSHPPSGPSPDSPPPGPRPRISAGRLNGFHAEPGTILGPKEVTREYVVVIDNDDRGVLLSYATTHEIDAAMAREPRSVAEHRLQLAARGAA